MNPPPNDPWLNVMANLVVVASAGTWIYLVNKRFRDGVLLEYAPRRPVPWGPVATFIAILMAVMTVGSALTMREAEQRAAVDPSEVAWQLGMSTMFIVLPAGGFAVVIALVYRALPTDLGFPLSAGELGRDIWLGILTCLAAAPLVFGAVALLHYIFDLEEVSHHPLIEIVGEANSSGVLLLATVMTVLVAPVCEEITFRLLLQGWLEKWDLTAWDQRRALEPAELESSPADSPRAGWTPILVSAAVFAAAHFGYGPEPVPIFMLAVILGYVYRQTHRIVPCIVAHAVFNSISMVILWRMMVLDPV